MAVCDEDLPNYEDFARPVLNILLVGFHHQKGSTIEFSHPPLVLASSKAEESLTSILSKCSPWSNLPHFALPDGCHNFEEENVYFTLPDLKDPGNTVFGVACCRQIEANVLLKTDDEITRSTVQKSICVLSRFPVFGFIKAKVSLVTHAFFNGKDFSNVQLLRDTYDDINSSLTSSQISSTLYFDLTLQEMITRFHHRLLQIFKALLLKKRVLLYAPMSLEASKAVLSILSLFPNSLEQFTALKVDSDSNAVLNIFSSPQSFQPYLCLQQMDDLKTSSSFILCGVVNPLFEKQQSRLCDIFADLSTGHIAMYETQNDSFKSCLKLSDADLRFCSVLSEAVFERDSTTSDWLGSNEWIRKQFNLYLLSLLRTTQEGDDTAKNEFNFDFMSVWMQGTVYKSWLRSFTKKRSTVATKEPKSDTKATVFSQTFPRHVCSGDLSVSDIKRRLLAQASDYGLNGEMVQQTQAVISVTTERVTSAVSQAWSSASSAVYKWWGGSKEKDEV